MAKHIVEIVENGKGYNVVRYSDGSVERRDGNRNWRNNNPGNIEYGAYAKKLGAIGSDGRFAIFPTYEAGRNAKAELIFKGKRYKDKTLQEAINIYAPSNENDTQRYIDYVTKNAGISAKDIISNLSAEKQSALMDAMQKMEGFKVGDVTEIFPAISTAPQKPSMPATAAVKQKPKQATALQDGLQSPSPTPDNLSERVDYANLKNPLSWENIKNILF